MHGLARLLVGITVALGSIAGSARAMAATDDRGGDVMMRFNGPVHVGANEVPTAAIVVNGDITVDGAVREQLLVVNGNATVRGRVDGEATVINGHLNLADGAAVNNVSLVNSDIARAPGAVVSGAVHQRQRAWSTASGPAAAALFWLSITLSLVGAGMLFALLGKRTLLRSADVLTSRPGASIIATFAVWIGIPVAAIIAMFTLIGVPFGLTLLLAVLPALWILGYVIAGTRLGAGILETLARGKGRARIDRPIAAAIVGIVTLQVIAMAPFAGPLLAVIAGLLGAGALVMNAVSRRLEPREPERQVVTTEPISTGA